VSNQVSENPEVDPAKTKAFAIIDVANFRQAVGRIAGGDRYADVRVAKLVELLRRHNYELTGLALALPTQVVQRYLPLSAIGSGMSTPPPHLKRIIDEVGVWRSREVQWVFNQGPKAGLSFRSVEILTGALDEDGEVGVDDLIVARAMIAAEEIRRDSSRAGEEILVFSHDTDLLHLSQYVDGVPLRVVGRVEALRATHGAGQVNWLGLTSNELQFLVPPFPNPGPARSPQTGTFTQQPLAPPVESRVAVVVDAYGLACSGAAALNIAELPDAASVRQCLVDLRLAKDSSELRSLTFVVPDINVRRDPRPDEDRLSKLEKKAWAERDSFLDQLATNLETDEEFGTNAIRGTLAPVQIPAADRVDATRLEAQQYIKRHSTLITAATLRKCFNSTSEVIVVMTDCPDVVAALEFLLHTKKHLLGSKQIIRLGIRAQPLAALKSRADFRMPYCVLTGLRLARLLRLTGPVGRELRSAIADSASNLASGSWEVVCYEPEVGGVRVRSDHQPAVELVVFNCVRMGLHKGQKFSGKKMNLEISADPSRPVDTLAFDVRGSSSVVPKVAVVVGRDANGVSFDYDDDGIPDGSVSLGHDFSSLEPQSQIVVGVVDSTNHRYLYVAGTPGIHREEQLAKVVETGTVARAEIDGSIVDVHPIQGGSLASLKVGDSVAAIDIGLVGSPHHVVLSSALGDSLLFRGH